MKTITIITEQLSDTTLAAVLPPTGIASVTVTEDRFTGRERATAFRGFRNTNRFSPNYRIDVVLDDAAVDVLFDSITIAYEAGFFVDAEVWVNSTTLAPAA